MYNEISKCMAVHSRLLFAWQETAWSCSRISVACAPSGPASDRQGLFPIRLHGLAVSMVRASILRQAAEAAAAWMLLQE
jgi:hypothetical protein